MNKKKKFPWQQILFFCVFLVIGWCCGYFIGEYVGKAAEAGKSMTEIALSSVGLFALMYVSIFLHTAIHEAGHLVFGLLTGYGFSSYRVGSLMIVKEGGKLKLRKFSLAGTGGQCLMVPPDMVDGKLPYVLYNLGGSIMNLAVSLLCLLVWLLIPDVPALTAFLLMMAVIGVGTGLMNGIPLRLGNIDNDGYNALSLGKDKAALRAFWVQMKVNERMAAGVRIKDMPEEWFAVPTQAEMKNAMAAPLGVFACNRLMDAQEFDRAAPLMEQLMAMDTGITGLHKNLMICDMAYCELIGENRSEKLEQYCSREQMKFRKTMKNFLTVLRTEYAYALLHEKDKEKAEGILARFEKAAKTYPYPSDAQSERELIQIAAQQGEA